MGRRHDSARSNTSCGHAGRCGRAQQDTHPHARRVPDSAVGMGAAPMDEAILRELRPPSHGVSENAPRPLCCKRVQLRPDRSSGSAASGTRGQWHCVVPRAAWRLHSRSDPSWGLIMSAVVVVMRTRAAAIRSAAGETAFGRLVRPNARALDELETDSHRALGRTQSHR